MLSYIDCISGDALISDSYTLKDIDDFVYEVEARSIVVKKPDVGAGGSPPVEEPQEDEEEGSAQRVINVVFSFDLQETQFDKKAFIVYLKTYVDTIKSRLAAERPDRVGDFEKKAHTHAEKILGNLKNYQFFTGKSKNPNGMIVLLNYREDGLTPYLTFWKDGLRTETV